MLKNNLKIAIRHLKRSKTASLINIFGLALALAAAFFIWEYIRLEKSYDRFHAKAERIYRLPIKSYRQGVLETNDAMNAAPAGPAIKSEYPEVEAFVRFTPVYQRTVFKSGEKQFEEDKIFYADSTLFDVFDFPVLEGDAQSCLDRPYTIIITRSVAERYFGPKAFWSESPIGQTIRINNEQDYEITAILEDVPENSHFKFNALISFGTFLAVNGDPSKLWRWNDFYTYILLREGTDVQKFASKIDEFNKRHYQWDVDGFYGETELQPLTDIHLHSKLGYEAEANGDANTIYFLSLIGLAIVIIAWVNYINLTTSGAEQRAGEVGVRKIIGASRKFLMGQFLTEALLVNSLAIALGVVLVRLGHPIMSALVDKQLPGFFTNPGNLLFLPLLLICGTLLAGLYPAWMLSSFSPAKTLKGEKQGSGKGLLRRGLVVFQYAVSVMLIIGTFVIYRQLEFMKGQDLGFAMDQQLIINTPTSVGRNDLFAERYQSFKKQLLDIPEIEYVGGSSAIPGKNYLDLDQHDDIRMQGAAEEKNASFSGLYMDDGFLEVFGLRLLAGRNFSEVPKVDYHSVIINESALALLELKDPEDAIGKMVNYQGDLRKIVGVVSDYHHKSLQH
ncbi:MAG: ABC transporter permease, partial [Lewinella sp.]|nr:ABC transporter permease [Lewinella sp.]